MSRTLAELVHEENMHNENIRLKDQLEKAETLIKRIYRLSGTSDEIDVKLWMETQKYLGGREKALKALEDSK